MGKRNADTQQFEEAGNFKGRGGGLQGAPAIDKAGKLYSSHDVAVLKQQGSYFPLAFRFGKARASHSLSQLVMIMLLIVGIPHRLRAGHKKMIDDGPLL